MDCKQLVTVYECAVRLKKIPAILEKQTLENFSYLFILTQEQIKTARVLTI